MIRNLAIVSIFTVSAVSFLTSEQNSLQALEYAPGAYKISEVSVTVDEGVENADQLQNLMQTAARNSVRVFNKATYGESSVPLKIHLSDLKFRDPDAALVSDQETYIEYTATLDSKSKGSEKVSIPVFQKHITPMRSINPDVKDDIMRNMIRTSLKKTLGKVYGLQALPESVQTHFNTQNIFALQEVSESRF